MIQKLHNASDDPALEKRLDETLNSLYWFHSKEIDYSLDRLEGFLKKLGNPHLKLPPVIHVAGTNGKGSTIATLRRLLEATNKTVHTYTSPHLVHPTERIRLENEPITTKALIEILEECLVINNDAPITFFEIFTAAVFLVMSRIPADYVLLETGMGGRLDATNIIPNPICTIITTISKDHSEFLGDSLEKIAREKAGIMKAGVPCVIGYQTEEAISANVKKIFQKQSQGLSVASSLYHYGSDYKIDTTKNGSFYNAHDIKVHLAPINLVGQHQIYNVAAAITAYRLIMGQNFDANILSPNHPKNVLGTIFWPGRLQQIENGPLFDLIKPSQELWIDGGHNDSAGQFLSAQAKQWQELDSRPLVLVIAMVNRKDPTEFITPLIPYASKVICTEIPNEKESFSAKELFTLVSPLDNEKISAEPRFQDAIKNIEANDARILATGSLYFMGALLST